MTETYKAARIRLMSELSDLGYKSKLALKVPQVILTFMYERAGMVLPPFPHYEDGSHILYFHAQAVYLDAHSTWLDIRGMTRDTFLNEIGRILEIRERV